MTLSERREMPAEVKRVYDVMWNDIAWLFSKWNTFRELFGRDPLRIELLNETDETFFGHLQRVLLDDVLIGIARITDSARSHGQDNMSLPALISVARTHLSTEVTARIDADMASLLSAAQSIRIRRHRRLAHRDASIAIGIDSSLGGLSRADISAVMEMAMGVMNIAAYELTGWTTAFQMVEPSCYEMITAMRKATYYDELVERGVVGPLDYLKGKFGKA